MGMKRLLSLFLAIALLVSLCACGGGSDSSSSGSTPESSKAGSTASNTETGTSESGNEEYTKLVVSFRTNGTVPSESEIQQIQEEVSRITRQEIGAEVEFIIIQSGSYNQQIQLMLAGSEKLDVMGTQQAMISSALSSGQLLQLDGLLEEYGQGIRENLDDGLLQSGYIDGKLYCILPQTEIGTGMSYFVMRKDLVEQYSIDVDAIKSYEDMEAVFDTVKENEPNLTIVAPRNAGNSFLEYSCEFDRLGDFFGVLDHYGDNLDVVNLFETDTYRDYLSRVRTWYQNGYVSSDVGNAAESGQEQMKAGTLFCYVAANKPGIETQEQLSTGCEIAGVQLQPTLVNSPGIWQWCIPAHSDYPEKSMQFIDLMYTNSDLVNLMVFGIEEEDYAVREDGRIGYPEGLDSSSVGYSLSGVQWQFGNQFLGHVWETADADIWEQTREWNSGNGNEPERHISKAYGFRFDNGAVQNEIAAVTNVYKEYNMSLECGLTDADDILDEMNQRLYDAGLQTIMNEKQKQLDEWAEISGVS